MSDSFVGKWRIIETEVWDRDALDLVKPARLTLEEDGMGSLVFIAVSAGVDYRVVSHDGTPGIEFSWEGLSEGDAISGRGWATLHGDQLKGRLFIHLSDDSAFMAERA